MTERVVCELANSCGTLFCKSFEMNVCCAPGDKYTFPCDRGISDGGGVPSSLAASSPVTFRTRGADVPEGTPTGVGFANRLICSNALRVLVDFFSVVVGF